MTEGFSSDFLKQHKQALCYTEEYFSKRDTGLAQKGHLSFTMVLLQVCWNIQEENNEEKNLVISRCWEIEGLIFLSNAGFEYN